MTTVGDLANSIEGAYSADDVAAMGPDGIVLTISMAGRKKVGGPEGEEKTCVDFEEVEKYVVLNKTRASQLTDLFGAEADPVGKRVRLYVDLVKVGGRTHRMICFAKAE